MPPALLVAGLCKPLDETTQVGFNLESTTCQGILCVACPQSGSSLSSAACVGPGLLVPLCEVCDGRATRWRQPLLDGMFVPWALPATEEAQGDMLRCTETVSPMHIPRHLHWDHTGVEGPTLFFPAHPISFVHRWDLPLHAGHVMLWKPWICTWKWE